MRLKQFITSLADIPPRQTFHLLLRKLYSDRHGDEPPHKLPPPVFVLSTGRVGTKTLSALAGLSPYIQSHHEPLPRLYHLSRMAYLDDGCLIKHPLFAEAFLTARRDFLAAASERRKGYVETSPQVTFLGPVIRKAIEGVKFIHLIRDPKRVVRSAMRRNWYHGHFMDNVRIRPLLDSAADQKWPSWSPFEKNLWLWAETNRWIKAFLADLPAGSYLTLTSEDLFGAQAETTEAFYQFLGVARPPEALIRRVLHHKLNAQSSGTFPRACNWSPHMLETTRCIAGPMMREFGYSV